MKINRDQLIGAVQIFPGNNNRLPLGTRQRWLLVDDDTDLLALLRQMIELVADVEVVSFSNSTEALLAFQADPDAYSLVITDYHMPGMDGMELCRRLRMVAPSLAVILATSDDSVSVEEALRRGFRTLLRKPYNFDSLTQVVARQASVGEAAEEFEAPAPRWAIEFTPARPVAQPVACSGWIASF
jgi:DNA-binding NtrC family response regulator